MNNISCSLLSKLTPLKHNNAILPRLYSIKIEEKIVIPKRIQRGPTDVLRALEATVSKDSTAAHYKYHDDPYLIPMSNIGKRTFAMAKESGRKAAHWIREQHSDLFQHKLANPPIELFVPKIMYNENSEVTEEDLKKVIENVSVSDAELIYKLLKDKNIDISRETLQDLLELFCYTNSENPLSEEFIEERWFKQGSRGKEKQRKTWKDGSLAEEIFISIDKPDTKAYSALIQGMSKYYQVDRVIQLYEEAQSKSIPLTTATYNALISVAHFAKEGYDLRWNFVIDILTMMNRNKVPPNIYTLNATLEILSTMSSSKMTRDFILKTLAEFKRLNIEPTLGSWYLVLISFCKERGPVSTILHDIMIEIDNKEHKIQDLRDTYFFVTAMDVCHNHLHDKDLANKVNKLLHHAENYNLIGDSYKESIYYKHYMSLLCKQEPLDEFIDKYYNKYVPNIYVPEPGVMAEILKSVEIHSGVRYLPKLWSDMIIFDHTDRENLLIFVLNIMMDNQDKNDTALAENFAKIAWDIWDKIEYQNPNRIQKLTFTGEMLGNIMQLVLANNNFEKGCAVMEKLDKNHHVILGVPNFEAMSTFVNYCIEAKAPTQAIDCVQYCADSGYQETDSLAIKIHELLTLDEEYLGRLKKIVGDIFVDKSQTVVEGKN